MPEKYSEIAARIWPFILPKVERLTDVAGTNGDAGTGGTSSGAPSPHALDGVHHSGTLADSQGPQFLLLDGSRTMTGDLTLAAGKTVDGVDVGAHPGDPDVHHARATAGDGLGISGQQLSLDTPGTLTAASTNAVTTNSHTHAVTATSDGDATPNTILQTDANGFLEVRSFKTDSIDADANLTLLPTGDLLLDPTGNDVRVQSGVTFRSEHYASQTTGYGITYAGAGDFRYLFADEMHVKVFVADLEQALAGLQMIAKSVAFLAVNYTVPGATGSSGFTVKDLPSAAGMAVFESGDIVSFQEFSRAGGQLIVGFAHGTVSSHIDNGNGTQDWTFTRLASNQGSIAGGTVIEADSLVLDMGVSGNGYLESNAVDGYYAANAPYHQVVTWATSPANKTVRTRLGNLTGLGFTNEWGLYAAGATGQYIKASGAGLTLQGAALEMYNGGAQTASLIPTGSFKLGTDVSAAATTSFSFTAATGDLLFGRSGAGNVYWNNAGGTLNFRNGSSVQAYVDTDGTIKAGGGAVVLDTSGLNLAYDDTQPAGDQNSIVWYGNPVTKSAEGARVSHYVSTIVSHLEVHAEHATGVGRIELVAEDHLGMVRLDVHSADGVTIYGGGLTLPNNTALQMEETIGAGGASLSMLYLSTDNDLGIGAGLAAGHSIALMPGNAPRLTIYDTKLNAVEPLLLSGTSGHDLITSAPPTAGSNIGWKVGLYSNTWAIGIAPSSLVVRQGANGWLALFNNANPDGHATTTEKDANAYFGVNINYLQYDGALGGGWTDVSSFGTNWSAASGMEAPGYKKFGDVVYLCGAADTTGDNNTNAIFTLPVGYRPGGKRAFACAAQSESASFGIAHVEVNTNGTIYLRSGSAGSFVALDNIAFTTTT